MLRQLVGGNGGDDNAEDGCAAGALGDHIAYFWKRSAVRAGSAWLRRYAAFAWNPRRNDTRLAASMTRGRVLRRRVSVIRVLLPLTLRAATTAPVKSRMGAPMQTVAALRSSTSTA